MPRTWRPLASVLSLVTMASLLAVTTPTERFEKSCFFDGYSQKPTGFLDIALADTGSMTLQLDQLVHMFTMEENCTMIFRCPVPGRILPEDAPEKVCEIVDSENLPLTTLHTRVDYNRTKYPELNRGTYSEEGDPIVEVIAVGSITSRPIKIHCHVSNYTSEDLNGPVGPVDFTFRINVKSCPEGKYGKNCRQPCYCPNGALCHSFTGACHCAPGWKGVHCNETKREAGITSNKGLVEPSYVSENVTMTCRGYNLHDVTNITWYKDGSEVIGSDRINVTVSYTNETQLQSTIVLPYVMDDDEGVYSCVAMTDLYAGVEYKANKTITVKGCPDGMYGEQCEETCDCAAQSTCYRYRGCVCLPGRTGPTCEQLCDDPALVELQGKKWGENCSNSCTCENEGLCDIQFGNCSCGNGFTGENCEFDCPDGTFGNNCTENCTCAEGEICSKVTGDCLKQPSIADEDWFIPVMSFAGVFVFLVVIAIYLTVKVRRRKAKKYLKLEGEEDTLEVVKRVVQEENSSSFRQVTVEEILTWEISREEVLTERMLGQGAFGDVLQARWTRGAMQEGGNGITVAAKKMRDCSSTKAVRDFLKEAYHLINIGHHRNIVNIHGICLQEGPLMLVLEYCEHGCVLDYLWELEKRGRMETIMDPTKPLVSAEEGQKLTGYAVDVCNGLKHLASKRYVHRDIAARNVVIHGKGMAKICDFGLTRDVYTEIYTKQGLKDATLPYKWMAIESLEGDGECTHKSDMWSFGVFLWELGTLGKTPYRGMDTAFLVEELHTGYRLPKPKGCPQLLYDLMFSCWQEDPEARPEALEIWKNLVEVRDAKTGFFSYVFQTRAIADTPDFTDSPVPEFTDTPDFTDTPVPDFTDTPDIADIPDFTDTPDVADIPDVANVPAIAAVPAVADVRSGLGPVSRLVPYTGHPDVHQRVMDVSEV